MNTYQQLKSLLEKKYPNYAELWRQAEREGGEAWISELNSYVELVFGNQGERKLLEAVDGYAEFCTEAIRSQIFFEKHNRYQASNYQEVLKECYQSYDYMMNRYLPGQFVSHFIWPHHRKMLQGYMNDFLPVVTNLNLFYEVGVGCGMYSLKTLKALPHCTGKGFDISQYALDFTQNVVDVNGCKPRYSTENRDIIAKPLDTLADFVISQEVLEHLEDPLLFIKALRHMVKPGGFGYITAAINAGHTDHIYLYRDPSEVAEQLSDAGWEIRKDQIERNYPNKPKQFQPTVAGFLVYNPA